MDVALQLSGCSECLGPPMKLELTVISSAEGVLLLMDELCHQVKELWEEISRLCSVHEDERERDRIFPETLQLQESHTHT